MPDILIKYFEISYKVTHWIQETKYYYDGIAQGSSTLAHVIWYYAYVVIACKVHTCMHSCGYYIIAGAPEAFWKW